MAKLKVKPGKDLCGIISVVSTSTSLRFRSYGLAGGLQTMLNSLIWVISRRQSRIERIFST
ncbi:hypothetical protein HQ531_10615 [bacterium]|nr:hypothetical protein [bacterium]